MKHPLSLCAFWLHPPEQVVQALAYIIRGEMPGQSAKAAAE